MVVVDLADLVHPLLLGHVKRILSGGHGALRVADAACLARWRPVGHEHARRRPIVVVVATIVDALRLSGVGRGPDLLEADLGQLRSRGYDPYRSIVDNLARHSRHVGGVDIVDRVGALARIEGRVHELLRVLAVQFLRALYFRGRAAGRVAYPSDQGRIVEINRRVDSLLQGQGHALIQGSTGVLQPTRSHLASSTTHGLVRHAHGSVAVAVMGTHLLLGKLRRSQIIVGRYELLVAFARADMPALHRIVMHLALSLCLLPLQL